MIEQFRAPQPVQTQTCSIIEALLVLKILVYQLQVSFILSKAGITKAHLRLCCLHIKISGLNHSATGLPILHDIYDMYTKQKFQLHWLLICP